MSFYHSSTDTSISEDLRELELYIQLERYDIVEKRIDQVSEVTQLQIIEKNNIKALALQGLGKFTESLIFSSRSCRLSKDLDDTYLIVKSHTIHASGLWRMGDIHSAFNVLRGIQPIAKNAKSKGIRFYEARILMLFANLFWSQGYYSLSAEYTELALKLWEKIDEKNYVGYCLNNLGFINLFRGDIERSLEYYIQAYPYIIKQGGAVSLAHTLTNIVYALYHQGKRNDMAQYIDEIKALDEEYPNIKLIYCYYKLSMAFYYKIQNRIKDKVMAEELLIELKSIEAFDFQYERLVLIHLIEIYLQELEYTGNPDIVSDIRELLEELSDLLPSKGSNAFMAEQHLLQSKLSQIVGDFMNAEKEILQGIELSSVGEFFHLKDKLEAELKELSERKITLQNIASTGTLDRISLKNMQDVIKEILSFKLQSDRKMEEIPILFQIINEGGTAIYSKELNENLLLDENLVGNFLSAISTFAKEAFETQGTMESIKLEGYNIIVKTQDDYLFCYVYKGRSPSASIYFGTLVERILSTVSLPKLNSPIIDHKVSASLDSLVERELSQVFTF